MALLGFSLGGNLALLALGRSGARCPQGLLGAAAVSPPLDLGRLRDRHRPARQPALPAVLHDVRCVASYAERQRRLPDLYEAGRERGLRTMREFDEAITAPYGGFASAADYYARSSAGPQARVDTAPRARSWPRRTTRWCPAESVARWPLPESGVVRREMTPTGGHVGFVGRTRAAGRFWAAERVMRFLAEAAKAPA